jgi:hypothetical protein
VSLLLLFPAVATAAPRIETPSASGGYAWRGWYSFGDYLRRKYPERKKVERAIEQEIAALMEPERPPVKAPEEVGREYLAELRQAIAEAQKADEQFRRFIEKLQLADTERLENLLRLEAALRREIARRRDEEETLLLQLLAA